MSKQAIKLSIEVNQADIPLELRDALNDANVAVFRARAALFSAQEHLKRIQLKCAAVALNKSNDDEQI